MEPFLRVRVNLMEMTGVRLVVIPMRQTRE